MYIKYNNELFYLVDKKDYYKIVTRKESKSDKTFYSRLNVFIKEIAIDDLDIRDIYDVDFFVIYFDESETIKKAAKNMSMKARECCNHLNEQLRKAFGA